MTVRQPNGGSEPSSTATERLAGFTGEIAGAHAYNRLHKAATLARGLWEDGADDRDARTSLALLMSCAEISAETAGWALALLGFWHEGGSAEDFRSEAVNQAREHPGMYR